MFPSMIRPRQTQRSSLPPKAGTVAHLKSWSADTSKRFSLLRGRITRRHEDAEDVVQQSFQKAFTHLRKFEGNLPFPLG